MSIEIHCPKTTREKVDECASQLNDNLDNIKGKNPNINFVIGDLNAKILYDGVMQQITKVKLFHTLRDYMVSMGLLTHFYSGKILLY